jgi:hypothetical protein
MIWKYDRVLAQLHEYVVFNYRDRSNGKPFILELNSSTIHYYNNYIIIINELTATFCSVNSSYTMTTTTTVHV